MNGAKGFANELVLELTFVRNFFECGRERERGRDREIDSETV